MQLRNGSPAPSYFLECRTELLKGGYKVPRDFADPTRAPLKVCRALDNPDSFKETAFT